MQGCCTKGVIKVIAELKKDIIQIVKKVDSENVEASLSLVSKQLELLKSIVEYDLVRKSHKSYNLFGKPFGDEHIRK